MPVVNRSGIDNQIIVSNVVARQSKNPASGVGPRAWW